MFAESNLEAKEIIL